MFHRPPAKTWGYVLGIGATTGVAVAGGIFPAYIFPWWSDQLGHFASGIALALWLRIVVNPRWVIAIILILSVGWEAIECAIGAPFHCPTTKQSPTAAPTVSPTIRAQTGSPAPTDVTIPRFGVAVAVVAVFVAGWLARRR